MIIKTNQGVMPALISLIIFATAVGTIAYFLPRDPKPLGLAFMFLSILPLFILRLLGRALISVLADIVFGFVDTGAIVALAVLGAKTAGIFGAVVGAVVGDAVADGFAGIFEGRIAQFLRQRGIYKSRTALSCSMGKAGGCLFGAGVALMFMGEVI